MLFGSQNAQSPTEPLDLPPVRLDINLEGADMKGYEIYKRLKYGYFTWIGNEPNRSKAAKRVRNLNREHDGSSYFAVAKGSPSLLMICAPSSPLFSEPQVSAA
jgi:hypothetical protein